MKRLKRCLAIGLLLVALAVAVSSASQGRASFLVVPDDSSSIQKAIEASAAGGLVIVKEGTYRESMCLAMVAQAG